MPRVKSVVFRYEDVIGGKSSSSTSSTVQQENRAVPRQLQTKSRPALAAHPNSANATTRTAGLLGRKLITSPAVQHDADSADFDWSAASQMRSESCSSLCKQPLLKPVQARAPRNTNLSKSIFDLIRVDGKRYSAGSDLSASKIFSRNSFNV